MISFKLCGISSDAMNIYSSDVNVRLLRVNTPLDALLTITGWHDVDAC